MSVATCNTGFSKADASRIITIMSKEKYKEFFLDHMMVRAAGGARHLLVMLRAFMLLWRIERLALNAARRKGEGVQG